MLNSIFVCRNNLFNVFVVFPIQEHLIYLFLVIASASCLVVKALLSTAIIGVLAF